MCRAVTCGVCGKTTWAGCGRHVEEVMAGVPTAQRCQGHADTGRRGLFAALFSRGGDGNPTA
nr:hypothetical protein [Corynebacterium pacaense]